MARSLPPSRESGPNGPEVIGARSEALLQPVNVVRQILFLVPLSPTATKVPLPNPMRFQSSVAPVSWLSQTTPFVEVRAVPISPTATNELLPKATEKSEFTVP